MFLYRLLCRTDNCIGCGLESERLKQLKSLFGRLLSEITHEFPRNKLKRSRCRNARIKLTNGSCRGVARICEYLLAFFFLLCVEFFESFDRKINFATNFQTIRKRFAVKFKRNRWDRSNIHGYILSNRSVPSRRPGFENTIAIHKGHGKTVNLRHAKQIDRPCA